MEEENQNPLGLHSLPAHKHIFKLKGHNHKEPQKLSINQMMVSS